MENIQWFDPAAAAIVLGGTLLAALLRCGWRDTRDTLAALGQLLRPRFDSARVRAELAGQVRDITADGLLRAEPHRFGDGEFDDMAEALLRRRSIVALHDEHERHRARRAAGTATACSVLGQAAELAPVLGLAGTLLSLGGITTQAGADGDYVRMIGMAVTTTLYGLVIANFLFAPLAAMVERRARVEEAERQQLLEWLAAAVERATARASVPQGHSSRDAA